MTRSHPSPGAVPGVRRRDPGEPLVWLTALGLTVGLFMILFLLGLVLVRGLEPFWPRPVAELTLRPDSDVGARELIGVVMEGEPDNFSVASDESAPPQAPTGEWQLYLGNRELYGLAFIYVPVADISNIAYPPNVIRLERTEDGTAFGIPQALIHATRGRIEAGANAFDEVLRETLREVNQRRERIEELEKGEIGRINNEMTRIRRRLRALEAEGTGPSGAREQAALVEHQDALNQKYQELAAEARRLRELQDDHLLVYEVAGGEEQTLPMGSILEYYYPNRLGRVDQVQRFVANGWTFLSEKPRAANTEGGIFPAILGTFVMTLLMSIAVVPLGVLGAIYLREYARQGFFVRSVRIAVNNLAGVPSIVFGVFGLGFFVYLVGGTIDSVFFSETLPEPTFGTGGILWASLTLALMTVPVVIVATEEALASVPRGAREGSLACGTSKWQTIQRIVLPASAPGILTGLILAMARAAGEVAPLMLVGVIKLAPVPISAEPPFIHLDQKFMHLGFHIFDLGFQSPDSEAAKPMVFATTLLLIALVILLNLGAIWIRAHLRKKFAAGAF